MHWNLGYKTFNLVILGIFLRMENDALMHRGPKGWDVNQKPTFLLSLFDISLICEHAHRLESWKSFKFVVAVAT